MEILDPSLDIWSEPQGRKDDLVCVGTDGWFLVALVLTGAFGDLTRQPTLDVTFAGLRDRLSLSESTVQRLAKRMEKAGLAIRSRGKLTFHPDLLDWDMLKGNARAQAREKYHARDVRDFRNPKVKFERRAFLAWAAEQDPKPTKAEADDWFDNIQEIRRATAEAMAQEMAEIISGAWEDQEAPVEVSPIPAWVPAPMSAERAERLVEDLQRQVAVGDGLAALAALKLRTARLTSR